MMSRVFTPQNGQNNSHKKNGSNSKAASNRKNKKSNKKSRAELNEEGRLRKKIKNRKGLVAGSRANPESQNSNLNTSKKVTDPRVGSKTKIDLEAYKHDLPVTSNIQQENDEPQNTSRRALFAELKALESNDRLDDLLEELENEVELTEEDQLFVDTCLDRIDELYQILGIDIPEESEDVSNQSDEENSDFNSDLLRILKS